MAALLGSSEFQKIIDFDLKSFRLFLRLYFYVAHCLLSNLVAKSSWLFNFSSFSMSNFSDNGIRLLLNRIIVFESKLVHIDGAIIFHHSIDGAFATKYLTQNI